MSTKKPNYLNLTAKQKEYIDNNHPHMSVETMTINLYTSRHEVMAYMLEKKYSLNIKKRKRQTASSKPAKTAWLNQFI